MKRFIVFKESNGTIVSHGTLLFCPAEEVCVTSHPLDAATGTRYLVSRTGLKTDAQEVTDTAEIPVSAPGVAAVSTAPYVYKLQLLRP